jgi:hypothetical protein
MPRVSRNIDLPDNFPPQGWGLLEMFDILWPQVTPYLEHIVRYAYPHATTLAEATEWAWSGTPIPPWRTLHELSQRPFPGPLCPEIVNTLTLMMAATTSPQSIIESFIEHVLTVIADLIDLRDLRFTAIDPTNHTQCTPAGGVLRTAIAPPDRLANRIRREDGQVLADLRFYLPAPEATPDAAAPAPLPLASEFFPTRDEVLIAMAEAGVRPGKNQPWDRTARQVHGACGVNHHERTLQRHWKILNLP